MNPDRRSSPDGYLIVRPEVDQWRTSPSTADTTSLGWFCLFLRYVIDVEPSLYEISSMTFRRPKAAYNAGDYEVRWSHSQVSVRRPTFKVLLEYEKNIRVDFQMRRMRGTHARLRKSYSDHIEHTCVTLQAFKGYKKYHRGAASPQRRSIVLNLYRWRHSSHSWEVPDLERARSCRSQCLNHRVNKSVHR